MLVYSFLSFSFLFFWFFCVLFCLFASHSIFPFLPRRRRIRLRICIALNPNKHIESIGDLVWRQSAQIHSRFTRYSGDYTELHSIHTLCSKRGKRFKICCRRLVFTSLTTAEGLFRRHWCFCLFCVHVKSHPFGGNSVIRVDLSVLRYIAFIHTNPSAI